MREQNEEANEILYEKYRPLIIQISKNEYYRCGYLGIDLNDLIGEGMIGLSYAINTFDDVGDYTFYSYVKVCIESFIKTYIKNSRGLKYRYLNESISYDNTCDDYSIENKLSNNDNPLYGMLCEEDKIELYNRLKNKLTDLEYEVFKLKVEGLNNIDIASILNKNPKNIDNALSRIKGKIRR